MLTVDLGTSHAVAVLRWPDGRSRPLLFDGQPVLPVGVYCDEAGELHVGRDAVRLSAVSPARFEPYPKRVAAQESVLLGEREVGVAAMFATALRRVAVVCAETTGTLPRTVLTCPSSWSSGRRDLLADAAAQAGFGPVAFVTEPVAAAHYYRGVLARPLAAGESLAVIDFGAGTVDVAVVAADADGALAVVAEGGVDDFGGIDLDAGVVAHLRATVGEEHAEAWAALEAPRTEAQRRARHQLWAEAREAKEMLSRFAVAPVGVPGVEAGLHLTRAELDAVARPLLEPVLAELARVRDAADRPVGAVFLVGGASRMPLVANLVHAELGVAPVVIEQPELAVAEGAAVAGAPEATAPLDAVEPERAEPEPSEPAVTVDGPVLPPAAPGPRRITRPAVAVGAAAAVLVLIGLIVFLSLRPDLPAGGDEPFTARSTAAAADACPEGTGTLAEAPGTLRGPHFSLGAGCLLLAGPGEVAGLSELLGETPELEDGERLALVHFPADQVSTTLPEGSAHAVATEIVLGDEDWTLEGLPEADSYFAAVVGEDAAATVAVTDAERTQTLDLSTGEVADRAAAYYHGVFGEDSFTISTNMTFESGDGEWYIESATIDNEVVVTRSAFTEERGWLCGPDQAVLTASFKMMVETEWNQDWPFDAASQLWIDVGEEVIAPRSVEHTDEDGDQADGIVVPVNRHFIAEFVVPADLLSAQFAVALPEAVNDHEIDTWLYATNGGGTKRYTVDFSA